MTLARIQTAFTNADGSPFNGFMTARLTKTIVTLEGEEVVRQEWDYPVVNGQAYNDAAGTDMATLVVTATGNATPGNAPVTIWQKAYTGRMEYFATVIVPTETGGLPVDLAGLAPVLPDAPTTDYVVSFNGRTGVVVQTSGDITTALGFTPANDTAVAKKAVANTFTQPQTFQNAASQIQFGEVADRGFLGAGSSLGMSLAWGAKQNASNQFEARLTTAAIYRQTGTFHNWSINSGLTVGNTFTPTELMRLNANGLGVGTSNPGNKLDVQSSAAQAFFGTAADTGGWLFGNNTGLRVSFGSKWDGSQWPATATSSSLMQAGAGVLTFYCNTGLTVGVNVSHAEQARINTTGLGVGTTSPGCKVDVAGTIRATNQTTPTSGAGVELLYASSVGWVLAYDRGAGVRRELKLAGQPITMETTSGTRLTIGDTAITAAVPVIFASYTLSTLPTAASFPRSQVWCSDHTGGARFVYSDGTNWRDVRTGNIAA